MAFSGGSGCSCKRPSAPAGGAEAGRLPDLGCPEGRSRRGRFPSPRGMGAAAAPSSVSADRWGVLARGETLDEATDLVGLLAAGKLKVEELEKDKLPEELRKLSPEELKARIAVLVKEREEFRKELSDLQAKRAEFLKAAAAKSAAAGKSAFDLEVGKALRAQGARKGFAFPE